MFLAAILRIHYLPIMIEQVHFGVTLLAKGASLQNVTLSSLMVMITALAWLIDSNNASIGYWDVADRDFRRDVNSTIDFLDFMRQEFPKIPIVYKPGNHEYRLPALFTRYFPELATSPLAIWDTVMGFETVILTVGTFLSGRWF